ncbi:hypothetical protein PYW07_002783 [Mythimna separata]|uniref:Uncharacterized protein n=1 Tax=Mythimna separata TaxID=271217 RepID=A0AAD7YGX9_MYTSE|nr:hypothetical protein PYW07_002783 [Mythimna separata]
MVFYLICDYLKILTVLYFTISTKYVEPILVAWYSEIFVHLLLTCAPCMSLEIAVNDLEEIKCILAEQLLVYEDFNLRTVILQSLDYIDACTSKLNLWNNFPMDMKLVLRVFDLCASYIIALLQFVY